VCDTIQTSNKLSKNSTNFAVFIAELFILFKEIKVFIPELAEWLIVCVAKQIHIGENDGKFI